jgi:hypothetical protein
MASPPDPNDVMPKSSSAMDRILAQTLSMDAHQFDASNFSLLNGDNLLDDGLWAGLNAVPSSLVTESSSLLDPFQLSSLNPYGFAPASMPPLDLAPLPSILEPDVPLPTQGRENRFGNPAGLIWSRVRSATTT